MNKHEQCICLVSQRLSLCKNCSKPEPREEQERAKTGLKEARRAKTGPKETHKRPKRSPRGSKRDPRGAQEAPERTQKSIQTARELQNKPKNPQEVPKSAQELKGQKKHKSPHLGHALVHLWLLSFVCLSLKLRGQRPGDEVLGFSWCCVSACIS